MDGKSNRKYSFFISIFFRLIHVENEFDGTVCSRTAPLNSHTTLSQINKRRLEFGVDVETFRVNDRRQDHVEIESSMEEDIIGKRRRRLLDDDKRDETETYHLNFSTHRPNILRHHNEDEEALLQKTQNALRTLTNWSREQNSIHGDDNEDANDFDNLFNDKRSDKMLPSSPSQSSDTAEHSHKSFSVHNQNNEIQSNTYDKVDYDENSQRTLKMEQENSIDHYEKDKSPNHYNTPNFDELVDSSSNELEIDMSDRNNDKYDDDRELKRRKGEIAAVNKQSLYNAYKAATASLPYSTQSAFKPPAEVKHKIQGSSFPSEPFGGYSHDHEKSSFHKGSKHYTVLQPAGVGSRAATALQEARTVPSAQPARDSRPLNALSPPVVRGITQTLTPITKLSLRYCITVNFSLCTS